MNIRRGIPDSTSSTGEIYLRWLSDIQFSSTGNREGRGYAFPVVYKVARVRLVDGEERNDGWAKRFLPVVSYTESCSSQAWG